MTGRPALASDRGSGFGFMEAVVAAAALLVLCALGWPFVHAFQLRAHKAEALAKLRQLAGALADFAQENDGLLPEEGSRSADAWQDAAAPASARIWYNALPRLRQHRAVADYAADRRAFYQPENLLFLPAAPYPRGEEKLAAPIFAVAMNSKLQRRDIEGRKPPLRLRDLPHPARTAAFFEQGIPGEPKALPQQAKYDGSPKGAGRTFAARYGGKGILTFCDGHAVLVGARELLTETGRLPFPPAEILWARSPEEDPNK